MRFHDFGSVRVTPSTIRFFQSSNRRLNSPILTAVQGWQFSRREIYVPLKLILYWAIDNKRHPRLSKVFSRRH